MYDARVQLDGVLEMSESFLWKAMAKCTGYGDSIFGISDMNPRKVLQRNQDWSILTMTVCCPVPSPPQIQPLKLTIHRLSKFITHRTNHSNQMRKWYY